MRIATWNVNSLKVRMPRVEAWLTDVQPDVVCMQETKLSDSAFPALAFEALGYTSAHYGQGQWNGVAVLSRVGITDVIANFAPGIEADVDARILSARCGGVLVTSVYVPNGRSVDHEQYTYKLDWLGRLHAHLDAITTPADDVVVCGDFNIAPEDRDVYDPAAFEGATHVSRPERDALARLHNWGLIDVFRRAHDASSVYSWWDYRAGDFHQGRGLRIDLVLATSSVADRVEWTIIDRNARKGQQPSDHAPVVVDVAEVGE